MFLAQWKPPKALSGPDEMRKICVVYIRFDVNVCNVYWLNWRICWLHDRNRCWLCKQMRILSPKTFLFGVKCHGTKSLFFKRSSLSIVYYTIHRVNDINFTSAETYTHWMAGCGQTVWEMQLQRVSVCLFEIDAMRLLWVWPWSISVYFYARKDKNEVLSNFNQIQFCLVPKIDNRYSFVKSFSFGLLTIATSA